MLGLAGTSLAFMASPLALALFSILAIGELIADKLPFVPKRTDLVPLLVRMISGGVCGGALSIHHSLGGGAAAGALGAIAGAFAGYSVRRAFATRLPGRDLFVALTEDALAIGLSLLALWK